MSRLAVFVVICGLLLPALAAQEGGGNRLARESSPYLRQHADDPVDWYPWGEAAFEKARREEKVVFLSIGYSTCHWCHVMEHESFENEEIAKLLDDDFVAIKVDREERPDVDAVYMTFVQAISRGRGGWPLTVFLTPEAKPIWGATYLPREQLARILVEVRQAWASDRQALLDGGDRVVEAIRDRAERTTRRGEIGLETIERLGEMLRMTHDPVHGGFGEAPKFPRPHEVEACLARWARTGEAEWLAMAERTLDRMAAGGIRDHLAGGFHRYATDREWRIPHFEKMLYDQALIASAYVEAYRATGHERHLAIAREVLAYVLEGLGDPAGGFRSAEDADSEGVEGKFYVWRHDDLVAALEPEEARVAKACFGVKEGGNFADPIDHPSGIPAGTNILHVASEVAEADRPILERARAKLRAKRAGRVRPRIDDKVLAGWNGLAISAFAKAYQAAGDPAHREAAERAARFVLETMVDDGRLLRRYRAGEAGVPGYLDDHAFLALGLLDLYEATFEPRWFAEAARLADETIRLFHDPEAGGFFLTGSDGEELLARTKEIYDGALPSGNSAAALLLARLSRMTGSERYETLFRSTIEAFAGRVAGQPIAYPSFLAAVEYRIGPTREVVLAGALDEDLLALRRTVQRRYRPRLVLLHHPPGAPGEVVRKLAPFVAEQVAAGGRATAYVCEDFACQAPVADPEALEASLSRREK